MKMASFANDSAIKVAPGSELERAIAGAGSVSEIQTLLHDAARAQKLVEPDPFDTDGKNWFGFRPVEPGSVAAAKGFAKTLVIDGTKHVVEGATEAELVSNELALMRQLFAGAPAATTDAARDERGRFVAQPTADEAAAVATEQARLTQLEVDFRLGKINAADYIRQSGAINQYLESEGVSVEALKKVSNIEYVENWAAAVPDFLQRHPDWQGGVANQSVLQNIIIQQNWENEDPAAALEAAYKLATEQGLLGANPELVARDAIGKAQTFEELKAAVGYRDPQAGSGLWGR
jgi:hypothetical protein